MAVVRERVVLRKRRSSEPKQPNRIRLDKLNPGDELVVEIVVDKKEGIVHWYRFDAQQLEGRKSVAFSVSGDEVHWLNKAAPMPMLAQTAEKLFPAAEPKRRGRKPGGGTAKRTEQKPQHKKREPRIFKVLVFDEALQLVGIYRTLKDTAASLNLRPEGIDKLCKTKRPSQETGFSFRYWWKILDFDVTDFKMTAKQYDELCRRKPSEYGQAEE
ncbi:hypothetical protein [Alistipes putredinis]|uniref:hypothetical protein n=1 Tax=Alistipes putredinis TaxID=28117 RepID=UPI003AB40BD9